MKIDMQIVIQKIARYLKITFNFLINPIRIFLLNMKRNALRGLLIGTGIIIGVFSVIIATVFGTGIQKMAKQNVYSKIPATRIKIRGRIFSNPLNKFAGRKVHKQKNITWGFIKKHVLSIKGVKRVIPIQKVTYPISAEFPILSFSMKMDVIANGLPNRLAYKYIFPEYRKRFNWRFATKDKVVPVLVSKFIINAFKQMSVSADAPVSIDENFFKPTAANGYRGFRFKLFLGKSTFGASLENYEEREAVVVGFTDPDITSGISLPSRLVRRTKLKFQGRQVGYTFESAFIFIEKATFFESVVKALRKLKKKYPANFDLVLDREVKQFRNVSKMINRAAKSFKIPVMGFSLIVLFLSCLIIFFAFLYLIKRREKEIGLYRFFGSSRIKVIFLIVSEAIVISAICAAIGYYVAYDFITQYVPENYASFIKLLPAGFKNVLSAFNMDTKKSFMNIFSFNKETAFMICVYAVIASAFSALIPALIGAYRAILRSVNK